MLNTKNIKIQLKSRFTLRKNKFSYLITIILALFTLGCKKQKGPTSVSGRVVDAYKSQAIPGATVYLFEDDKNNTGSGGYGTTIQTTTSGSDGSYSFSFDAGKSKVYFATAAKTECQSVGADGSYISITKAEDNTGKDIPLYANGYVRLHIKNVNSPLSTDEFIIYNDISSNISSVNQDHEINLYGSSVDTIILKKTIRLHGIF